MQRSTTERERLLTFLSNKSFKEGWFYTGDIVEITNPPKSGVRVIDRLDFLSCCANARAEQKIFLSWPRDFMWPQVKSRSY